MVYSRGFWHGFRSTGLFLAGFSVLVGAPGASLAAQRGDVQSLRATLRKLQRQLERQEREIEQLKMVLPGQRSSAEGYAAAPAARYHSSVSEQPKVAQESPEPASEGAPVQGPSTTEVERQKNRQILETSPSLASTGGVLTPAGTLIVEPTFEYDYTAQNQAVVNGFSIVPGITFGNININKVTLNQFMPGVRVRLGLTDRAEVNAYIPYVLESGTTTTAPEGTSASAQTITQPGMGIGDIQIGGSYQINSGAGGWPVFVGNLQFKTITGTSPFDVPIFTLNDPQNRLGFLTGIDKRLPTGTGFYQLTPSLTVLYPTDPAVLFGSVKYIWNIPRTIALQSPSGGSPTPERLAPGSGVGVTVGLGFSLNDKASFSLGYEQDFYWSSTQNGVTIPGSSYSQGIFNFGLGYQISARRSLNLGVGLGIGPNVPNAQIVLRWSNRFHVF